ncbi:hypothetical protein PCANC_28485 [Puccinia coronata f. sp. avenae]|uniref:Uncharacterized protein n=1 Tax=Puccinia coronata f. sp. avenae TaxID=200324 RepID=A0A2N5THH5_9BASI|nr:hypothetical protein PCANC_28485 [Puccinia coronata f. sp. avenae]
MVTLSLTPKNGNNTRYFPHSGFLGLSPVVVAGYVQTRLEEDNQPLEASRLVVRIRCYEAIGSTISRGTRPELEQQPASLNKLSNVNVLWQTEQTLWAASQQQEYDLLGDWNGSWKLVIPTNAVDPPLPQSSSAASSSSSSSSSCAAVGSITYKTWRSWWQVETVVYHRPAGVLGSKLIKSHVLYLINYREAEKYYSSREDPTTTIQSSTTTNTRIKYSITSPTSACCGDEIQLKILIGTKPQHQPHPSSSSTLFNLESSNTNNNNSSSSNEPELILKRLQVSLIRRLAIELFTPSPPTNSSSQQLIQIDHHHKPWRLGRHLANPNLRPINPFSSSSSPSSNSLPCPTNPNSNSNSNSNSLIVPTSNLNSKRQFTTVNTLITNTEGISKSIVLNHHDNHHPQDLLADQQHHIPGQTQHQQQQQQVRYDYGFLVKLKIPLVKSKSHYSIGETCKTSHATVNFSFQFKLSIKNKLTSRVETIDLSELNVQVYSISKAEIQSALAQLKKLNNPLLGPCGNLSIQSAFPAPPHRSSSSARSPLTPQQISQEEEHRHLYPAYPSNPPSLPHIIPLFSFPADPLSPQLHQGLDREGPQ